MKKLLLFSLITIFLIMENAFTLVDSSKEKPVANKPTIVLVHGLWADGSSWNKVIAPLLQSGYKVISVQNPTTSLEDDVKATKIAIERAEGDVILVGHSWGGFVISEAGNDPKVKALVYVAAFMPDNGETIPTLSAKASPTKLGDYLQKTDGFISLTEEGVKTSFAADVTPQEQALIYATQPPASEAVFGAVADSVAWKNKPSWFIVAKNDGAISPDLERMMAKRGNAKTTEVNSSHVAMVAKPMEVLKVIEDAASSVSK